MSIMSAFLVGRATVTPPSVADHPISQAPPTVVVIHGTLEPEVVLAPVDISFPYLATFRGDGGTVTSLPEPGDQIEEGKPLLSVDLRPAIVMRGEVPMFRDLERNDHGADVVQFQATLHRLGWLEDEPNGVVGSSTLNAWRDLLHSVGADFDGLVRRSEVTFVPSLPARVEKVVAAIGQDAIGDLVVLSDISYEIRAPLPLDSVTEVARGNTVDVIDGLQTHHGTVKGIVEEGGVLIALLSIETDLEPRRTYRARIFGAPLGQGLLVPQSAIHATATGDLFVIRWGADGQMTEVPVTVRASTPTEVLINGDLAEGDELVVGQ